MISNLVALELVDGASSVAPSTTLTAQDLANIANIVWDKVIDHTYSAKECMRLQDSAMAGLVSGFTKEGGTDAILKSLDGLKDRITVNSDIYGNRTSITIDVS